MAIPLERFNKGDRLLENLQQIQAAKESWDSHVREKSSLKGRSGLLTN
jgi:hypothetical protein